MSERKEWPRKQRRPDRAIYTPKGRLNAQLQASRGTSAVDYQAAHSAAECAHDKLRTSAESAQFRDAPHHVTLEDLSLDLSESARPGNKSFQRTNPDRVEHGRDEREDNSRFRERVARSDRHTSSESKPQDEESQASRSQGRDTGLLRRRSGQNYLNETSFPPGDSEHHKGDRRCDRTLSSLNEQPATKSRESHLNSTATKNGGLAESKSRRQASGAGDGDDTASEWTGNSIVVTCTRKGEREVEQPTAARSRRPDKPVYAPDRSGHRRLPESSSAAESDLAGARLREKTPSTGPHGRRQARRRNKVEEVVGNSEHVSYTYKERSAEQSSALETSILASGGETVTTETCCDFSEQHTVNSGSSIQQDGRSDIETCNTDKAPNCSKTPTTCFRLTSPVPGDMGFVTSSPQQCAISSPADENHGSVVDPDLQALLQHTSDEERLCSPRLVPGVADDEERRYSPPLVPGHAAGEERRYPSLVPAPYSEGKPVPQSSEGRRRYVSPVPGPSEGRRRYAPPMPGSSEGKRQVASPVSGQSPEGAHPFSSPVPGSSEVDGRQPSSVPGQSPEGGLRPFSSPVPESSEVDGRQPSSVPGQSPEGGLRPFSSPVPESSEVDGRQPSSVPGQSPEGGLRPFSSPVPESSEVGGRQPSPAPGHSSDHQHISPAPGSSEEERRYTPPSVPGVPFSSPPEHTLAALHLTPSPALQDSVPPGAGRRDDLSGVKSWPSGGAGVLRVPGAAQRSRGHEAPPPPTARQLFDPNNPAKPLQVAPSGDTSRRRSHWSGASQQGGYASSPYPMEEATHWSAARSPAECENASRVSQLLGRAAGDVGYVIGTGRLLDDWASVSRIREHVQRECRQLIVSDLRTWVSLSVDQTVWRALYYSAIEWLRACVGEPAMWVNGADPASSRQLLNSLIDEGVSFFSDLLHSLQTSFRLPVERLGSLAFDPATLAGHRYVSVVAVISQRLLLCLGDLARYKHHTGTVQTLSEAHGYYLQAQRMNPKNGRPFNQLAILALYAHKRLDCVYFYMRALNASNPFVTAKESLLTLFHESAKKYAARRRPAPDAVAAAAAERRHHRSQDTRTETWVHPRGGQRVQRTLQLESDDEGDDPTTAEMSDSELMKAFTTSYLHVQGKLYTRVGLEDYETVACEMLRRFSHLLSRRPTPLKTVDMLHLLAINMFNIANTRLRDERVGNDLRSTYQELALSVAIEMAGHVIQQANQLLADQVSEAGVPGRLFPDPSLQTCIVFIKVWCDWLLCSSSIWNPPPCTREYRVRRVADCWASLARLTNLLRTRDVPGIRLESAARTGLSVVRLPEDLYLQWYTPLLCAEHQVVYVDETLCELELARDLLRLRRITFVTEQYLCGLEPAVLRLVFSDDASAHYISEASSHAAADDQPQPEPTSPVSEPDVLVEVTEPLPPSPEVAYSSEGERPHLSRLRRQKRVLEQRARQQEEHDRRLQEIVKSSASVAIEVRPRYLVADTNCYVDYLDQLMRLVNEHTAYTLTVPVTVVAELDGLTRPGVRRPRPGQSAEHVELVRRTARSALAFVRARGQPHVRCVTTKGHVLNSAAFTAEQEDEEEQVTNDDKILACCVNLERGTSQTNSEGVVQIRRQVVLLTEDRNLRLKALSLDVPTRTVPDFLAWAG